MIYYYNAKSMLTSKVDCRFQFLLLTSGLQTEHFKTQLLLNNPQMTGLGVKLNESKAGDNS